MSNLLPDFTEAEGPALIGFPTAFEPNLNCGEEFDKPYNIPALAILSLVKPKGDTPSLQAFTPIYRYPDCLHRIRKCQSQKHIAVDNSEPSFFHCQQRVLLSLREDIKQGLGVMVYKV